MTCSCAVIVVAGCAALGACKDRTKTPAHSTATTSAAQTGSAAKSKIEDIALLPGDAEVVIAINWFELKLSPVWTQLIWPELAKEPDIKGILPALEETAAAIKSRCGIDLATDVKRVTLGVKDDSDNLPSGAIVAYGLDKAKALACPLKFRTEAAKEDVTLDEAGESVIARDADGYGMAITFVDDRAVVLLGPRMTRERVERATTGVASLATSRAFREMHGKLDTRATAWAIVRHKSLMADAGEELGVTPTVIFGSFDATVGFRTHVRARFESAAYANVAAGWLSGPISSIRSALDKATVTTDGSEVTVEVIASPLQLDAVIAFMK